MDQLKLFNKSAENSKTFAMQIVENEFFESHQHQANIRQDNNRRYLQRFVSFVLTFHLSTRVLPMGTPDKIHPKEGLDPKLCLSES